MRITIVVPILEVSGGAKIVAGHAERLAARGHEVLIVAPRRASQNLFTRLRNLLSPTDRFSPKERTSVAIANVALYEPQHYGHIENDDVPDADVIVATWWETAEWIWPMLPSKGAKVHFLQAYEAFPNIPKIRVDAVWKLSTQKIAISQSLIDLADEKFGYSDICLVPNAIDDLFRSTEQTRSKSVKTLGFLFHNAHAKDIGSALAAIAITKDRMPELKVVSFGAVKPRENDLPPYVEFYHLPTQEEIAAIYRRCDVWLSTSLSEGFNLPPLEAMASGCPAVCSKTGRPLEIIEDGVNGYLVDQGDVEGFSNALARILDLPEADWQRMSAAARESVAHPTWEESSALFEAALQRAVDAERAKLEKRSELEDDRTANPAN